MRVLRRALIAFPLAVLSPSAAPASAETLGDARVGFSAERVLVIDGQSYVGPMWHSQEGIPMRCDARLATDRGKVSTIRWEVRHVKIGAQEPALFDIPRGYAKLPPEVAAPLLGMRLARPPAR